MTARSRQAAALGRALTVATGTSCWLELHTSRDSGTGGWRVRWSDGPTVAEMRAAVAAQAPQVAPLLDVDQVGFERGDSDLGVATALLWWLAQDHPSHEGPIDLWLMVRSGTDLLPGHPDRAPAEVRHRAEVLAARGWAPYTAGPIADELERHARGGWPAVAAWLDALAATDDLAARRHQQPR